MKFKNLMEANNMGVALADVGLACVAAYLNVHGVETFWLWFGVFLLTMSLI